MARTSRVWRVVGCALALCLMLPAAASALTEVEKTVNDTGVHSAVAKCPKGKHIVSGGGFIGTFEMSLGQPDFAGLTKARNGWKVSGDSGPSTADPFNVTAYAYCSKDNLRLRKSANEKTGAPKVTTRAKCAPGTHIVSGGGLFTSDYGISQIDARARNGWKLGSDTTLDGGSIGLPATTRAEAYCTKGDFKLRTVKGTAKVEPNHIKSRTVRCPKGTKIVSGGGDAGGVRGLLWFSRAEGNGWRITVTNYDTEDMTMTAYAYCH